MYYMYNLRAHFTHFHTHKLSDRQISGCQFQSTKLASCSQSDFGTDAEMLHCPCISVSWWLPVFSQVRLNSVCECACYLSSDILSRESQRVHPTRTGGSARTVMSQQLYRKADTHTRTHTHLLRKQCPLYSTPQLE